MLQCYANGAVVFNAEHPFYCTGVNDKASWALKESILPAFRYITEKPAASRDAVAAEIKAGIFTSNKTYLPQNYAQAYMEILRIRIFYSIVAATVFCRFSLIVFKKVMILLTFGTTNCT